jgi:hypothetical protein
MDMDTLKRRLRSSKPQPTDNRIELSERDLRIFEALYRHGPLPTHYLHEFAKDLGKNFAAHQHRLTKLYNGTKDGRTFLSRPPQQFASYEARYQPLIYDLTPKSKQVLAERGRLSRFMPDRTDPFVHRFMGACISASIDISSQSRHLRYISKDAIFKKIGLEPNPLSILAGNKSLIPDDLFGLEYPGKSYRFFAVEIDRNTESIERTRLDQNAFGTKLRGYLDIAGNKTYRSHWGIPNLLVLTVTTNVAHMHNILGYLKKLTEHDAKAAERFLFKAKPEFGSNWRVPEVMSDILTAPWLRADGTMFVIDDGNGG